jgi:hypothetical protein
MTRSRPPYAVRTSALAVLGLLLSSLPAFAQEPPAPPPPPPPAEAVPPAAVTGPPVASAMTAPKSADDMTGSLGFGVGVIPNAQLIGTTGQVAVKYWMSDMLAIVPALNFTLTKAMGTDAAWVFNPEAVVLFVPFRSTATRFSLGGGLGFGLSKNPGISSDTTIEVYLPIQAGVEHFFTRWFSMGIAARTRLVDYTKTGTPYTFNMAINTASLLGSVFFYTD